MYKLFLLLLLPTVLHFCLYAALWIHLRFASPVFDVDPEVCLFFNCMLYTSFHPHISQCCDECINKVINLSIQWSVDVICIIIWALTLQNCIIVWQLAVVIDKAIYYVMCPPGQNLSSRWRHNVLNLSICPYVWSFICYQILNARFWKQINRFWWQLSQVVHGACVWNANCGGQEIKGRGHTRQKIDLEAWQRHYF